jgi:hypothetical protein
MSGSQRSFVFAAFTHNIVRHVANGVNILGEDDIYGSQEETRLLIQNTLFRVSPISSPTAHALPSGAIPGPNRPATGSQRAIA